MINNRTLERILKIFGKWMTTSILLLCGNGLHGQEKADSIRPNVPQPIFFRSDTVLVDTSLYNHLSPYQQKTFVRQIRRDSIRAGKNLWLTPVGGPSYNPEASLGIGGALLASFKINSKDTVAYRSFLPIGFNLSINGTIVVAGAGTFFFKENKFRIYTSYSYRNEPAHYYGKGYEAIGRTYRSDSTTAFRKESVIFNPRFMWQIAPHLFAGPLLDINYSRASHLSKGVSEDPYFRQFRNKYLNIGTGGLIQYDTRDDIATPNRGMLISLMGKVFGKYLGGAYNYELLEAEYRQFQPLFKRALLGWTAKTQMSFGKVPFTELPTFGSPFDLRGYYMGQYRDKSAHLVMAEYRHMFNTDQDTWLKRIVSHLGFVAWAGCGFMGPNPTRIEGVLPNYGVGLRIEVQPRMNVRLDLGKNTVNDQTLFYFNMTEAF